MQLGAYDRVVHASDFFAPEDDLLLLKVASIVLVDQHQIDRIAAREAIIYIFICWC